MLKINKEGKDIFLLSTSSLIAQLIPVFASIILARIYTAEQYGDWGIFLSYVGILSIIVMGQYEMAIVRPFSTKESTDLVYLCTLLGFSWMVLCYLVILVLDYTNINYFYSIPCPYLLPIYVFLSGLLQVYLHYANRKESYAIIAISGILRNICQAISRIIIGLSQVFHGLIFGALIGLLSSILYSEHKLLIQHIFSQKPDWKRIKFVAYRYRYFPMYLMPSSLLNALSTNLPVILLTRYFEKEYIGYFSMTISLLFIPIQLIGNAISKIFYKKSSLQNNQEEVQNLSYKLFKITFSLGLLINIILLIGGESLFTLVLGSEWRISGIYALFLSPWIWMTLCFSPLSVIFDSRDKQFIEFIFNIILFISRISVILCGGYILKNMNMTVLLYGMCGFIIWGIEGYVIFKIIGFSFASKQKILVLGILLITIILWITKTIYVLA